MNRLSLFVTGMQRSGTTLLEKLIARQPHATIMSQPFPLLFVEAKRAFLSDLGRGDVRYPLGHLFQEDGYRQEDFGRHLSGLQFGPARLAEIFETMQGYSGQYTRFDRAALTELIPRLEYSGFADLLEGLYAALAPETGGDIRGSKETICEEFLPYLLDCGWRCVLIVRDPRDVIASLNHGRGEEFGGRVKPTLLNIRNWRKSVAFALELEGRENFLCLRYEDVVRDPGAAMSRIADAFGLAQCEYRDLGDWSGNSSHGARLGVSTESVGAHEGKLPADVIRFVEATCLPEMIALGYPTSIGPVDARSVIREFEEPYQITRDGVSGDQVDSANAGLEVARLERLASPPGPDSRPWFLFEKTHARLREATR